MSNAISTKLKTKRAVSSIISDIQQEKGPILEVLENISNQSEEKEKRLAAEQMVEIWHELKQDIINYQQNGTISKLLQLMDAKTLEKVLKEQKINKMPEIPRLDFADVVRDKENRENRNDYDDNMEGVVQQVASVRLSSRSGEGVSNRRADEDEDTIDIEEVSDSSVDNAPPENSFRIPSLPQRIPSKPLMTSSRGSHRDETVVNTTRSMTNLRLIPSKPLEEFQEKKEEKIVVEKREMAIQTSFENEKVEDIQTVSNASEGQLRLSLMESSTSSSKESSRRSAGEVSFSSKMKVLSVWPDGSIMAPENVIREDDSEEGTTVFSRRNGPTSGWSATKTLKLEYVDISSSFDSDKIETIVYTPRKQQQQQASTTKDTPQQLSLAYANDNEDEDSDHLISSIHSF